MEKRETPVSELDINGGRGPGTGGKEQLQHNPGDRRQCRKRREGVVWLDPSEGKKAGKGSANLSERALKFRGWLDHNVGGDVALLVEGTCP